MRNKQKNWSISGKGHELLSMFDIEYYFFSKKITDELMAKPNETFQIKLSTVSKKSK